MMIFKDYKTALLIGALLALTMVSGIQLSGGHSAIGKPRSTWTETAPISQSDAVPGRRHVPPMQSGQALYQ